jgi:CubicO group peptidase (beta-lactamase class C family)
LNLGLNWLGVRRRTATRSFGFVRIDRGPTLLAGSSLRHRRRLIFIGVLFLTFLESARADQPSSLDRYALEVFNSSQCPGLSYVLVNKDEISSNALGEIVIGSGDPITPDTPVLLGSISKGFTAIAIMQLVEANKLSLNTRISDVIDCFEGNKAGDITVLQFLGHTSGYSTIQGNRRRGGVRTIRTSLRFDLKPALSLQAAAATQQEQRCGSA